MRNTPASSPGEKYLLITLERACARKVSATSVKNDEKIKKKLFIGKKEEVSGGVREMKTEKRKGWQRWIQK